MNPDLLLKLFHRISDAPEAIPHFRQFIIDLSVRGKLVEQDPSDEPASESLKRVRTKRKLLTKEKTINNAKLSGEIHDVEKPYPLPSSWQWIRLGEFLEMINGRAFKPTDWIPAGLPIVRIQNLNTENAPFNYCDESIVEQRHIIESGCFLISWSGTPGTSFGAFIWERGRAALNQHIFRCLQIGDAYYDRFLQIAINGRLDEMIAKAHGGVGLQHITKGKLENLPLSLPPIAEQYRIVAKLDELMALCDRLEAAQNNREIRRERLAAASHHHLNNGSDPEAIRRHAAFYFGHLPQLTTRPVQIKQLRQTILNLAVQGFLVRQDPNDESAARLLGDCRLFLDSEVERWKLPSGWAWSSFNLIGETLGGGTPSKSESELWDGSIPWVSPKDMKVDIISDSQDHISAAAIERSAARLIPTGSLLMVVRGMILAHSFPTASTAVPVTINQDMKAIVPFRPDLIRFLILLTKGLKPEVLKLVLRSTHGTCKLLTDDLFSLPIPIPPLAEQCRIVTKVDELMALCDRLELQLVTAQDESVRLLESVLHHALHSSAQVLKAGKQ